MRKYAKLDSLKVDTEEKVKIICRLLNESKSSAATQSTCTKEIYGRKEDAIKIAAFILNHNNKEI